MTESGAGRGRAGILAPIGTPAAVIDRLHAELVHVLRDPEVAGRFVALAMQPAAEPPDRFAVVLAGDAARAWLANRPGGLQLD
jgi:tripartite-type tricarboxylate transporter receptor subunit TctC